VGSTPPDPARLLHGRTTFLFLHFFLCCALRLARKRPVPKEPDAYSANTFIPVPKETLTVADQELSGNYNKSIFARRNGEMFSTLCQHPTSSLRSFKKRALGVGHIPDIPRRLFQ
jgi:hypothetical protein